MITQEDLDSMVRPNGFIDYYWRYLYGERQKGRRLTMEQAYEELDEAFHARFRAHLWPSYDAFRHARGKKQ